MPSVRAHTGPGGRCRAVHRRPRACLLYTSNSGSGELFFLRRRAPDRLVQTVVELCRDRLPKNMGIPAEQIPVSYTHLDVYKRQGLLLRH